MGLDAGVCCDCFERGQLRSPPPAGSRPSVCEDGGLLCGSDDLDVQIAFDGWLAGDACEHEYGRLVQHHIGNIALVGSLRSELQRDPDRFPLILERVIYNGVHGDDFIPAAEVPRLAAEVEALAGVRCADPNVEPYMRAFAAQMCDLVSASRAVNKPIVF